MLLKEICIREMLHIHLLSISFLNQSLNMWDQMLILCGHTYLIVNLSISCIKEDKK